MQDFLIAPSLLSANFACLGQEANNVLKAGGNILHLDVMDNHYVPNLTMGPMVCEALRNYGITAPIDVHLMAKPVDRLIVDFAKAGATYISFHPETSNHIDRSIDLIHHHGCKAGLAFNPATPLSYLDYVMDKLDCILIMSVNPGFGGQSFISTALEKIKKTRALITASYKNIRLAVDGGVKIDNIRSLAEAGADIFIAGSAIFNHSHQTNYAKTITAMRHELEGIA